MNTATIRVKSLKVALPLRADEVPRDIVPMDGPAGEPVIVLELEGSDLTVRARLNGKTLRRVLKTIDEHAGNVAVVLQGTLRPADGGYILDGAGFTASPKTPKPQPGEAT